MVMTAKNQVLNQLNFFIEASLILSSNYLPKILKLDN